MALWFFFVPDLELTFAHCVMEARGVQKKQRIEDEDHAQNWSLNIFLYKCHLDPFRATFDLKFTLLVVIATTTITEIF